MKFLVTAEPEPGMLMPEQVAVLAEKAILPSLETLAKWEADGEVIGGVPAGYRGVVFLIEAATGEEIGDKLTALPFWRVNRWKVTPLQSFDSAVARQVGVLNQAKAEIS